MRDPKTPTVVNQELVDDMSGRDAHTSQSYSTTSGECELETPDASPRVETAGCGKCTSTRGADGRIIGWTIDPTCVAHDGRASFPAPFPAQRTAEALDDRGLVPRPGPCPHGITGGSHCSACAAVRAPASAKSDGDAQPERIAPGDSPWPFWGACALCPTDPHPGNRKRPWECEWRNRYDHRIPLSGPEFPRDERPWREVVRASASARWSTTDPVRATDIALVKDTAGFGHHDECNATYGTCTCAVGVAEAALRLLGIRIEDEDPGVRVSSNASPVERPIGGPPSSQAVEKANLLARALTAEGEVTRLRAELAEQPHWCRFCKKYDIEPGSCPHDPDRRTGSVPTVNVREAREALARLHTFSRGHGNNIAANRDWETVDNALDALEVTPCAGVSATEVGAPKKPSDGGEADCG